MITDEPAAMADLGDVGSGISIMPVGEQRKLFASCDPQASAKSMAVRDAINAQHRRGTLRAAIGFTRSWATRAQRLSPRYTTRLEDILQVQTY